MTWSRNGSCNEIDAKGLAGGAPKYPDKAPLAFAQETVKRYLPRGATCWRGNVRSEWWGHFEPFKREVNKVEDFATERGAILATLKVMWMQYNFVQARNPTECPTEGIF